MKARFGIPKLDEHLGGGLDRDTVNLITGRSGVGKTILASQWAAEGARNGESVVYIATTLTKKSVSNYIGKFKFMEGVFDKIHWRFIRIEPKFLMPVTKEKIREGLEATFKKRGEEVDRVVFDTATDLDKTLADPVLYRRAIRYMAELCHDYDVTAIFIEEAPMIGEWSETKNLAESIIFLDLLRVPRGYARALRILKKYRTAHTLDWIPFEITDNGIEIKEGRYVRVNHEFEYEPGK
jgi:KaiC/GvpD/RAD55 family RecA-like ATPase